MFYSIHLWQHPEIMSSKDLPPRKRIRERLNEVFAAYRPRRSKDREFHELEVAPDDKTFPRLLKQFQKEVNRTAGVGGYFDCSLTPAELPRARFLQVRIAGEPVDRADDGGRWLNDYPPLCPACRWPDIQKPPRVRRRPSGRRAGRGRGVRRRRSAVAGVRAIRRSSHVLGRHRRRLDSISIASAGQDQ